MLHFAVNYEGQTKKVTVKTNSELPAAIAEAFHTTIDGHRLQYLDTDTDCYIDLELEVEDEKSLQLDHVKQLKMLKIHSKEK